MAKMIAAPANMTQGAAAPLTSVAPTTTTSTPARRNLGRRRMRPGAGRPWTTRAREHAVSESPQFWHRLTLDTRAAALSSATYLLAYGPLRQMPAVQAGPRGCEHEREEDCDCPPTTAAQREAFVRLAEEGELDRLLRVADVLAAWLTSGLDLRQVERGAELDRLNGGES